MGPVAAVAVLAAVQVTIGARVAWFGEPGSWHDGQTSMCLRRGPEIGESGFGMERCCDS